MRRSGDVVFTEWRRECVRGVPGSSPGTFGTAVDEAKLANSIATVAASVTESADAATGTFVRVAVAGIQVACQAVQGRGLDRPNQGRSGENKLEVGLFHWSLRGTHIELEYGDMQACATAGHWQPAADDFALK